MKLIYIASPFNATNPLNVLKHTETARRYGTLVANTGIAWPVIPQANTLHLYGKLDNEQLAYDGTLEMLKRCDGMLLVTRENSEGELSIGVDLERACAHTNGIPVFDVRQREMYELRGWIMSLGVPP